MSRSPEQIQQEIDSTRQALAGTLDQIVTRANPKRLIADSKQSAEDFFQSDAGRILIAAVGGLVALLVVRRIRLARKTKRIAPQVVVYSG